jgi:hypothetical protein
MELVDLKQIFAGATILLGLAGCIFFHLRLRTAQSLAFLCSVAGLTIWLSAYNLISASALGSGSYNTRLALMHQANEVLAPVLGLLASLFFLLAARRIVRPNNSFKPKPLRGSA